MIRNTHTLFLVICIALLSACGSVRHEINLNDDYTPKAGTKIEIGKTENTTGQEFDIDVEQLFTDALAEELRASNMLWSGEATAKIKLQSKITEYEEGNAFKRWLMPGWGATIVSIQCDLREGSKIIGTVDARRTVSMGGGYTIDAWRTIFADIAKDVVSELKPKIYNH